MKKCAVYTRVSTSMQAEKEYNSCEAQRDKILSYVKSQEDLEIYKEYSDPGFSGSSLERPALKALVEDIKRGQIEAVLTYKIDRLTRSSKDFYALIELFEKHNVSYVSVTERFDTSSPSGRLLRNIMLTFAQFEREMIAERIKDKFEQRAVKGMWNCGRAPFGYKWENKKIVIHGTNSKNVKDIFEVFVSTGSIKETLELVRANKVCLKDGEALSISTLWNILRNPVYFGKMRWNGTIHDGLHEAIISKEFFEEAQSLMKDKVKKRRLFKEFLLSGLLTCSDCGSSMTNTFTNKKKGRYYYYKCVKVVKEGKNACSLKEVNAQKLEGFLIENLSRISEDRQYLENLAFRILHESPHRMGFELGPESEKKLLTRISGVLMEFKTKVQTATQIEKCLIFEKTIERIKFSKRSLEVSIFIKDTA